MASVIKQSKQNPSMRWQTRGYVQRLSQSGAGGHDSQSRSLRNAVLSDPRVVRALMHEMQEQEKKMEMEIMERHSGRIGHDSNSEASNSTSESAHANDDDSHDRRVGPKRARLRAESTDAASPSPGAQL